MKALKDIRKESIIEITQLGIESPVLCVDVLLAFVLGFLSAYEVVLSTKEMLSQEEVSLFYSLLQRAKKGEPIAYIVGKRDFLDSTFKVTPATLIPRPETEELVLLACKEIDRKKVFVLDIGTGSGVIACSIYQYCINATVVAMDISLDALSVAVENFYSITKDVSNNEKRNDITFIQGDLYTIPFVPNTFDYILSNPPYISEEEHLHLAPTVANFEPYTALVSGRSGLEAIFSIIDSSYILLKEEGILYMEVGYLQHPAIVDYVAEKDWVDIRCIEDMFGKVRFIVLYKKSRV